MLFCEEEKRGRSKASLFSALPKLPSLVRDFPALHRHLQQHLQPFPWAPPGTLPGRYLVTRVHSGFVPYCLGPHKRGSASPTLLALNLFSFTFPGAFSAEKFPPNQHPQVILLMNFTWVWPLSLWADTFGTFDGKDSVFSFLYKAKSTDSTAQLNTAISLQLQGELNTQQCQIISSRVFPLDICRCKWGLLDTFCLSNHRLATTTAELTIISPSALRYL